MSGRKPISKKTRFEVFKRDKFTCQYCGSKAPEVLLHVDHVKPVAGGGSNAILNLVTSCASCNGGKGARPLSDRSAVEAQHTQAAALQERREQLELMMRWHEGLLAIDDSAVDGIVAMFQRLVPGWSVGCESGRQMVLALVQKFGVNVTIDSLREAATKFVRMDGAKATEASSREVVDRWKTIASYAHWGSKHPLERDLRYIRGILRKRVSYCPEDTVLRLLHEAADAGVSVERLRSVALDARVYTHWECEVQDLIRKARGRNNA